MTGTNQRRSGGREILRRCLGCVRAKVRSGSPNDHAQSKRDDDSIQSHRASSLRSRCMRPGLSATALRAAPGEPWVLARRNDYPARSITRPVCAAIVVVEAAVHAIQLFILQHASVLIDARGMVLTHRRLRLALVKRESSSSLECRLQPRL